MQEEIGIEIVVVVRREDDRTRGRYIVHARDGDAREDAQPGRHDAAGRETVRRGYLAIPPQP
jgi:hypothetical protein